MDHRDLRRLVRLMNRNGLVEVEIEREGERIHLRKAGYALPMAAPAPLAMAPAPAALPAPAAAPAPGDAPAGPPPGTREIASPMVGTFYRRPSPDAEPFVAVGQRVDAETVVCIVEAMKVNNEIKAEMSGTIEAILAEDGEPIEYGRPLFRVKVA